MMEYAYLDYIHVELGIKEEHVQAIAQSGSNDAAVAEAMTDGYIAEQLTNKSDAELYRAVDALCDGAVCESRDDAIKYLAWIAAWDIAES